LNDELRYYFSLLLILVFHIIAEIANTKIKLKIIARTIFVVVFKTPTIHKIAITEKTNNKLNTMPKARSNEHLFLHLLFEPSFFIVGSPFAVIA
jgi:hypothetical protein